MLKINPLKIYIGYDSREHDAWHTCVDSIMKYAKSPVAIVPLKYENLPYFDREWDSQQSNSFAFTRFLVPYLNGYQGFAIFMDCDMMLRTDINEVMEKVNFTNNLWGNPKAVSVVKHDYIPKNKKKYLGATQYAYPRKNWSSFVVWNCGHPSNWDLTPQVVNTQTGKYLHRFEWLSDDEIGSLDVKWNWLVGEYDNPPDDVKNVHWTVGGPWFDEFKNVDFSDEWRSYGR